MTVSVLGTKDMIPHNCICVVGGGIAGTVAALALARLGLFVDIFERNEAFFMESSKIPVHLYTGVQYFAELDKAAIRSLFLDAIAFARLFPFGIKSHRPTVLAIAKEDIRTPSDLEALCRFVQTLYRQACDQDRRNEVFGKPSSFYTTYTYEKIVEVRHSEDRNEHWIKAFANNTNLELLQFPIIVINEWGIDMTSIARHIVWQLEKEPRITCHLAANVQKVERTKEGILLTASQKGVARHFEYRAVVDASGMSLGRFEAQLGISTHRCIDVKMAGLFAATSGKSLPEIYILGGKGNSFTESFMTHVSPVVSGTKSFVVVNVTTSDCTYISDGKQANGGFGMCPIGQKEAFAVLNDPFSHTARLKRMQEKIALRHPALTLTPCQGLPGAVTVISSSFFSRESSLYSYPEQRLFTLNIAKASGVARVIMSLMKTITKSPELYNVDIKVEGVDVFSCLWGERTHAAL
jgi:hypothetical protein